MANTLEALCAKGHRVTLVAPYEGAAPEAPPIPGCRMISVPVHRPSKLWHALEAQLRRLPWTVVRHRPKALRKALRQLLATASFDVIHAEQVQAWGALQTVDTAGTANVWRAQNVESDLWRSQGASAPWPLKAFLSLEARRLALFEGRAVAAAQATVALTRQDAHRLAQLSGGEGHPVTLPAPFVDHLPAADHRLPGEPALVLLGSRGWRPNREGAQWFADTIWPRLHQEMPNGRLHVFGALETTDGAAVSLHPSPEDSRQAFAPGSILIVPLQVASGVRMKILEAWARGIPVVATPVAARGLEAKDGDQLFIAETPEEWGAAVVALNRPERRQTMVDAARHHLTRRHDLGTVVDRLLEVYSRVMASSGPTSSSTSST